VTGRRWNRRRLDDWFPTVARYAGVVLLFYAAAIDRGGNPALIPAAMGMILFKSVYGQGPPDKE
jgi:hypothetical protein